MDRVSAGGRAGRGGVHNRPSYDEGYAAHAASPSGHKRGRERSDSRNSSSTRDEFKEYALALRKRDRRGRVDEPVERERERAGGRFRHDRDYTHVSFVVGRAWVCSLGVVVFFVLALCARTRALLLV